MNPRGGWGRGVHLMLTRPANHCYSITIGALLCGCQLGTPGKACKHHSRTLIERVLLTVCM